VGKGWDMRLIFAVLSMLLLAQCAMPGRDRDFQVGRAENAYVIIGIAKAPNIDAPRYDMLWRLLDEAGAFTDYDDARALNVETNSNSIRVDGIPGEFITARIRPGVYALDGVYAIIRDQRVDYYADGLVVGPERPSFEVRSGEAIYLGIWQVDLEDTHAVTRPWRVDSADLRAAMEQVDDLRGQVRIRQTVPRAVPCNPQRMNNMNQRRVC
jgi:hypothetical protein